MLLSAIDTYNKTAAQPIQLHPTRDGRVTAVLPLSGRNVIVQGNITGSVKVGPVDVALVCQEARLAMAPGLALLDAALAATESPEPV